MYEQEQYGPGLGDIARYSAYGFAGLGIVGHYANKPQNSVLDYLAEKYPKYAEADWFKKVRTGKNLAGGFWHQATQYEKWDTGIGPTTLKSGTRRMGKMRDAHGLFWNDIRMYGPRRRAANGFDTIIQNKLYKRGITKGSAVWKAPAATLFGLALINAEVNQNGFSGFITGPAKEFASQAGGRLGMAAGTALGHAVSGGFALGGYVGLGIGAVAGAMAGYAVVDTIKHISKLGKQWSLPELGGSYKDSQFAMSMRQRSLNAIRTSQFNLRSELGNEAFRLNGL